MSDTDSKHTIELNGQRYDLRTGYALDGPGDTAAPLGKTIQDVAPAKPTPQVGQTPAARHQHAPAAAPRHQPHNPLLVKPRRSAAGELKHHPAQPARTLMRGSVKAPSLSQKPAYKPQASMDIHPAKTTRASGQIAPAIKSQAWRNQANAARAKRASHTRQSEQVTRFSAQAYQAGAAPAASAKPQAAPAKPAAKQPSQPARDPRDAMLDAAIAHARSHEQTPPDLPLAQRLKRFTRRHRRAAGSLASLVVVLAFAGAIVFQNRLHLQLQIASVQAGFSATLPGYQPASYHVGALSHNAGSVAVNFTSPRGPSYQFVQKQSNWNSQTLRQNYVASASRHFRAFERGGQTIFVYGGDNATWVNGGIWYQLHANQASLSTDQMLAIASSTS